MESLTEILILGVIGAAFLLAVVAQVLALYHFVHYWASQTPQQRWTRSLLGAFSLFWTRGLSGNTLRHLTLAIRWECAFLAIAGVFVAADFIAKQQPNNFIQAGPAQAPAADKGR